MSRADSPIALHSTWPPASPPAPSPAAIRTEPGSFVPLIDVGTLAYRRKYDNHAVKKTLTIPAWLNTMAESNNTNFDGLSTTRETGIVSKNKTPTVGRFLFSVPGPRLFGSWRLRFLSSVTDSSWEYNGAGEGNRTRDLRITSAPLYQLSYAGPQISRKCYVISSACVCQSPPSPLLHLHPSISRDAQHIADM